MTVDRETSCRFFDPPTGSLARDIPVPVLFAMEMIEGKTMTLGEAMDRFCEALGCPSGSRSVFHHPPMIDDPNMPERVDFGVITVSTQTHSWAVMKYRPDGGRIVVVKTMGDLKGIKPLDIKESR